jgi:hypothetical protein
MDNVFQRPIALEALFAQAYQAGVGIERLHHSGFKHRRRCESASEIAPSEKGP